MPLDMPVQDKLTLPWLQPGGCAGSGCSCPSNLITAIAGPGFLINLCY